jgi:hypothetical protein
VRPCARARAERRRPRNGAPAQGANLRPRVPHVRK